MPCSDNGQAEYEYREQKKRLDVATRLLCEVCRKGLPATHVSRELEEWWKLHQKEDARRVAEEIRVRELARKKKSILAKLTLEERRLLGL